MRFWTADTHFGHRNILVLGDGRPFGSIEEHDEALIANWNDAVGPDDEVWHLGDVSLHPAPALAAIPQLNGHITIVAGNHDRFWARGRETGAWQRHADDLLAAGVERVISSGLTETTVDGIDVVVSHLPFADDPYLGKLARHRPSPGDRPLICGHVHGLWKTSGRQINVGVDQWGYRLVAEDVVATLLRGLPAKNRV